MMEALCTSGRRGVYRVFGKTQTLRALARRGLVTMDEMASTRSAFITQAGLDISAEQRKTAITS